MHELSTLIASGMVVMLATATPSSTVRASDSESTACDSPLAEPGDYNTVHDPDGVAQEYWVVAPDSYSELVPIPLYLHLASGPGRADISREAWRLAIDDVPALTVFADTDSSAKKRTDTLLSLIDEVSAEFCVDAQRIHVIGSSSSASAASLLACEASDRIASFTDGMGGFGTRDCVPERAVPLLAVTGDPDRPFVTNSVGQWADHNGCDPEPIAEDLGSGVTRYTYQGCAADIEFYDFAGLGHSAVMHVCGGPYADLCTEYEEYDDIEEMVRFFSAHPLP